MRRALGLFATAALLTLAAAPNPLAARPAAAPQGCLAGCALPLGHIQAELDAAVTTGAPGVVEYVRAGDRVAVLTAGQADVSSGRPIRADDRFRIASMTKMFVATVTLQLVEEHRLGLDDAVRGWLPDLVSDPAVTVRHLLQHSSGLFDFGDDQSFIEAALADPGRTWSRVELVAVANGHPTYFAAGAGFHYTNTGYVLLGALIERVTGHPAAAELRHRIFQPLHLDHTYVARDATIRGRHATGYTPLPDGGLRDVTRINATLTGDSGNMISTVSDVARFEHALISGRLLGRRALQQMLDVAPVDDPPQNGYGLGIFTTPQACGTSYGHGGGIFGFSSEAQEMADGQRQSVAFVNSDDIPEGAYPHLAAAARLSLCGEP